LTAASGIGPATVHDPDWSEDDESPTATVKKVKSKKLHAGEAVTTSGLQEALKPLRDDMDLTKRALFHLREKVDAIAEQTKKQSDNQWVHFLILVAVFVAFQAVILVMFKNDPNRVA